MSFPTVSERSQVSLDYATVKITGEPTDKELKVAEKVEKKRGLDEQEDGAEEKSKSSPKKKPSSNKTQKKAKKSPALKRPAASKK